MNKKGELITLSVMVGLLIIGGIIFISNQFNNVYIGDSSQNITYNIKSKNPLCNPDEIIINENYVEHFNTIDDIPAEYTLDINCN